MTKFEVSDAMLDAAEQAYDTIAAIEHDAWWTRAAITAAIEASGILEENARLRDVMQTARGLLVPNWRGHCDTVAAVQLIDQALNKDTTNDQ